MNTTDTNRAFNESSYEGRLLGAQWANAVILFLSFTVISVNCSAVYTLYKCRRMPFQIKWLSCNVLLSDTLMHVFLFCLFACVLFLGRSFLEDIFYIRIVVGANMALVSLASVSGLILERLVALTKTMIYSKILSNAKVILLLMYIWLPHMMIPMTIFALTVYFMCNFDISLRTCNTWLALLPFRLSVAAFFLVYHSFIIYAYAVTYKILKRHAEAITKHTVNNTPKEKKKINTDTTTQRVTRIVLVFELINMPLFIHSLIFAFVPALQVEVLEIVFQATSYACSCINSFVNLYLYVWKMKECRVVFLNTFFSWSRRCRAMAHALKLEVYPFVAYDNKSASVNDNMPKF